MTQSLDCIPVSLRAWALTTCRQRLTSEARQTVITRFFFVKRRGRETADTESSGSGESEAALLASFLDVILYKFLGILFEDFVDFVD